MIEDQPSRTAERVAMRRAAHQMMDDPPVLADPLAMRILGPARAAALEAEPSGFERHPVAARLRAFLAARSRLAEHALAEAFAAGVRQYVVLGAGLDTFAYRNPHEGLLVFEVDHPATQAWKRERLSEAGIAIPPTVSLVPVDFAVDDLRGALERDGLDVLTPTFFSWLGVTPYLTPETVLETLEALVPLTAGGGGIAFDYMIGTEHLTPRQRRGAAALSALVQAAGEPFQSDFEPNALVDAMHRMGYREIHDLGPDDLNATLFAGRADGLRVGSLGRILLARGP